MDFNTLLILIGGPILALLTTFVTLQVWALKAAKDEGVKEEKARVLKDQVDAAHRKIREDIMPKLATLESTRAEDNVRMEKLTAVLAEVRQDGKQLLEAVQTLAVKIADIKPGRARG